MASQPRSFLSAAPPLIPASPPPPQLPYTPPPAAPSPPPPANFAPRPLSAPHPFSAPPYPLSVPPHPLPVSTRKPAAKWVRQWWVSIADIINGEHYHPALRQSARDLKARFAWERLESLVKGGAGTDAEIAEAARKLVSLN
ncbi:unnamed protein product [Closterium sp. Naga37s-1]|nr:unnamed protein product [Closterium sp. Naga37s-1]